MKGTVYALCLTHVTRNSPALAQVGKDDQGEIKATRGPYKGASVVQLRALGLRHEEAHPIVISLILYEQYASSSPSHADPVHAVKTHAPTLQPGTSFKDDRVGKRDTWHIVQRQSSVVPDSAAELKDECGDGCTRLPIFFTESHLSGLLGLTTYTIPCQISIYRLAREKHEGIVQPSRYFILKSTSSSSVHLMIYIISTLA
ncbi:hypothetical protein ARMGADRAFT_1084797 [Armillaria gallica]|uniref:Uncharacterized protein n=1 Tax=Armillaria gallica TaxID=47427 RepID=A0A2H3DBB1_ARMGA|nr:hypothetical protein ARMGADRAFT_1084797 [Armillaria gallica]